MNTQDAEPPRVKKTFRKTKRITKTKTTTIQEQDEIEEELEEDDEVQPVGPMSSGMMATIRDMLRKEMAPLQAELDTLAKEVIHISSGEEETSLEDEAENRSSDDNFDTPEPSPKRLQPSQLHLRAPSTRKGKGTHSGRSLQGR
ncbi:hypothetical protein EJ02DRAFT_426197 [Clathrospora elynae]|uniref:Uncharacterized protein n=1 Tax=Clathrospora elynae TaxID=706981 RepID=A0A6A5SDS9_9PLEO|nr:hypothetical protein EJ02DRAFT_426197 [Clathrospora elynae]